MNVNIDGLSAIKPECSNAAEAAQEGINQLNIVQVPNGHVSAAIAAASNGVSSIQAASSSIDSVISRVQASEASNNQIVNSLAGDIAGFSFGGSSSSGGTSSGGLSFGGTGGFSSQTNGTKTETGSISKSNNNSKVSNSERKGESTLKEILSGTSFFKLLGKENAQKILNSILDDYENGKIDINKMTEEEIQELMYKKAEEVLGKDIVKIMKTGGYTDAIATRINQILLEEQKNGKIDLSKLSEEEYKKIIENRAISIGAGKLATNDLFQYFNGISKQYGYQPSYLESLFNYKNGDTVDTNKFYAIKTILEKNYNMTNTAEAANFVENFNNTNLTSYSAVANTLLAYYKDNPDEFKEKFGTSLYTYDEKGMLTINNDLLLDVYVVTNRDLATSKQSNVTDTKTSSEILANYLKNKNVDMESSEIPIVTLGNKGDISIVKEKVKETIESGGYATVQLKRDEANSINIIDSETNQVIYSTNKMKEGATTQAYITGYNEKGVNVSYNGTKCIINFSDLEKSNSYGISSINIR